MLPALLLAAVVPVTTAAALGDAVRNANPGDVIEIAPGTYAISGPIRTGKAGTKESPITIRGTGATAEAKLDFRDTDEGLVVNQPNWIIEHVWVNGACDGGGCGNGAGGIHVNPGGDRVVIRYSKITNWEQNIKTDRSDGAEPTDGQIIGNEISNTGAGYANGGTGIDIVGGLRWYIAGNYVHDWARGATRYGIFVKGGAKDAVIERNLVVGARDLPAGPGAAVGISFGGGGTGSQYCAPDNRGNGGCTCETFAGIARNNIVAHTNDAALHTKRACGSVFASNTVHDSGIGLQIQIEGPTTVLLANSVLDGRISGKATDDNNALSLGVAGLKKIYADPDALGFGKGSDPSAAAGKAKPRADVTTDYFGHPRTTNDLGAIELAAAGTVWPWSESALSGVAPPGTDPPGNGNPTTPGSGADGGAGPSGNGATTGNGESGDDGGCSMAPSTGAGALLPLLAVLLVRRRRQRGAS